VFSSAVESTRHPDAPDLGTERSRFQSRVLGSAAVIATNHTDSVTGLLVYNSDDNQHVQAAAVRPAQRVPIKAHRASPRSGAATYPATGSRPPTSLGLSGPIARTAWTHAPRRTHNLTRKHVTAHCHA